MTAKKPARAPEPMLSGAARIQQLRDWLADAERQGVQKTDLLLRLTHRDVAAIKRHPSVRAEEVAFDPAGMSFLGVRVAEGAVADSLLEQVSSAP